MSRNNHFHPDARPPQPPSPRLSSQANTNFLWDDFDDFFNCFFSVLRTPWRELPWGNNERVLESLKDYQPPDGPVRHIRVLLYGPVGSGKSSFVNSVSTVLRGRIGIPALTSATSSDRSFTLKYKTHKIKKNRYESFYPFVFNDIMGLEEGDGSGININDIKMAMKGHLMDGHKFNPVSPLSDDDLGYNSSPSPDDKVHVLVCVWSANTNQIKPSVLNKMRLVRETASELGIPQLAILTKIDEACGETEKNLRDVYKSKHLKKKMTDLSSSLGIPMNCILPVKNYSHEISTNEDVDTLILSALKLMTDFGDDFIQNQ